jgi:hypothetical protein
MPAPLGNRFWEARSSHGRTPTFNTPDDMLKAALEYFEWVEANPLWEAKVASNKGEPEILRLPKLRAMTLTGLCNFLDISEQAWRNYRKKEDFVEVCSRVESIIRQQKFEGAAADMLNPSIIARDLGLADKQQHEITEIVLEPDADKL